MNTIHLIDPKRSVVGYQILTFPDGQPHIKLVPDTMAALSRNEPLHIVSRITDTTSLLIILLANDVLKREGFFSIHLHITYLLGARMDRVMAPGEPFSLQVVAGIINSAGFATVHILDPHSPVATSLIERSVAVNNHHFVADAINHYIAQYRPEKYSIVSPDAGAARKIGELAMHLGSVPVVHCTKVRNPTTGALSGFATDATDLGGQTCIIVDDICDGGGTFAGTAATLRQAGAGKVVLVVTHGIFSKGIQIPDVDAVYCTSSYRQVDGIHCMDVCKYLPYMGR